MKFKSDIKWLWAGTQLINLDRVLYFKVVNTDAVEYVQVYFTDGSYIEVVKREDVDHLLEEMSELAMGVDYSND